MVKREMMNGERGVRLKEGRRESGSLMEEEREK